MRKDRLEKTPELAASRHLELPRGFQDVLPDRMAAHRRLQAEWFKLGSLAGHQPVGIPPVGFADTFTVGHHAAGGRTYNFSDRRGRPLALVSDSLPAALRLAQARRRPEQRLSYCCPVFRYERKARRYFHHLGFMETSTGTATPETLARSTRRIVQLIAQFLQPYLTAHFTITEPGLWYSMLQPFVSDDASAAYLNELRQLPANDRQGRLRADGVPDYVLELARRIARDPGMPLSAPWPADVGPLPLAIEKRINSCLDLAEGVRRIGAEAVVDFGELHASEFHDGPSFLIRDQHGTVIGDGGSYGRFAERFLGFPAQLHAAVVGLERMADYISMEPAAAAKVAILAASDPAALRHCDELASSLRGAGISVWDLVLSRPLKHHLREAAELRIPYSVLIGSRELSSGQFTVRGIDGNLYEVPKRELCQWFSDH